MYVYNGIEVQPEVTKILISRIEIISDQCIKFTKHKQPTGENCRKNDTENVRKYCKYIRVIGDLRR